MLCIGAGQLFHLHLLFTSYGAHTIVHQSHLPFLGHHLGQRYPLWPSMCVAQVEYSKCCSGLHLVIVCFSNFHAATSVSSDRKQQQLHFDCCWQHLTCSIDSLAGVSEALVLWTKDRCWQFWCCQSQILGDRSTQKGLVVNWEWRRIVQATVAPETGDCTRQLHQTVASDRVYTTNTQSKWWCCLLQSTRSISDDYVILCHLAYTWAQGGMSFMSQHLYQIGTCRQMMSQAWHCSEFSLLYGFCSGVSGSIEHCQVGIAQIFWYLQVQPACISQ